MFKGPGGLPLHQRVWLPRGGPWARENLQHKRPIAQRISYGRRRKRSHGCRFADHHIPGALLSLQLPTARSWLSSNQNVGDSAIEKLPRTSHGMHLRASVRPPPRRGFLFVNEAWHSACRALRLLKDPLPHQENLPPPHARAPPPKKRETARKDDSP